MLTQHRNPTGARNTRSVFKQLRRYKSIYLLLLPVIVYFLIFSYYPTGLGIFNSFHRIRLLGSSTWVGLANYATVLSSPVYIRAAANTLIVGIGTFVVQFTWGLLFAVCIHELRLRSLRSLFQTVSFLPYLLSWAVVGSIWISLLAPSGMVNGLLKLMLGEDFRPVVFMAERTYAQMIMIFTGAWKTVGYTAALLLAAIVSINPALYEAASIDGASRFKQICYIMIPSIAPTIKVVIMLAVMQLFRNFDQIFIMANGSILDEVRNLLYLIYADGIVQFKVDVASAAATLVLLMTMLTTFAVRKLIRYDENI